MTIITKISTEKKVDESVLLKDTEALGTSSVNGDVESSASDESQYVVLKARARRVSTATTLCLFLTALLVMSIGIIVGVYLYRQYAISKIHRFRGWCNIPYPEKTTTMLDFMTAMNKASHFKEEIEIDLDNENYEKIDVPDFQDGRRGRFIHDFNSNKTGIIDVDNHRCFVMPLNRDVVLPPRSLFDLIHKMWEGYYEVDTREIRETMRVITPPISDLNGMGTYIHQECNEMPTYRLEKYISSVVKRSADLLPDGGKFAQFSGNKILKIDILNFEEVEDYEGKKV